jgi:CBS domain-containing protein
VTTVRKIVRNVVALHPEDTLGKAWRVMRDQGLSALPVVDAAMHVVGVLTEDDLLARRIPRTRLGWWAMMVREPDELADSYRKAVGTTVADVMSAASVSTGLDATVEAAAKLMHEHRARMLPAIAEGTLAGVVTAADLIDDRALPSSATGGLATDAELVEEMQRRIDDEPWASRHRIHVRVHHGVVELDGLVDSAAERAAFAAMARSIPGCAGVEDHLVARAEFLRKVPALTRRI